MHNGATGAPPCSNSGFAVGGRAVRLAGAGERARTAVAGLRSRACHGSDAEPSHPRLVRSPDRPLRGVCRAPGLGTVVPATDAEFQLV